MIEINQIKLKTTSISQVPLQKYDQNFTFYVNGKPYLTNRIIADLLSPKICQNHFNDSSSDEFVIKTMNDGDFNYFLDLINFHENNIPITEIPFISEVIKILENDSIELSTPSCKQRITIDNVFELIQHHEKNEQLYSNLLKEEIDFVSSNFYEFDESIDKKLQNLQITTLENILSNKKLQLKTEDQLLQLINQFYLNDTSYSILYEKVEFTNVTSKTIKEFLDIFDINDITNETWKSLSFRLEQEIIQSETLKLNGRYSGIFIPFKENQEFEGIINYLRNNSKNNIFDIVNITASSSNNHKLTCPQNSILYDDRNKDFRAINSGDVWICFDFKCHRVVPFNYSIRSYGFDKDFSHPKSWVIEGSNDNQNWDVVDEQKNCPFLNGKFLVHTFEIKNSDCKKFQYIRMRLTGPNWEDGRQLSLNSIEFYGKLYY